MQKRLAILMLALSVCGCAWAQPDVTAIEYFYDTDPGFGGGTPVSFIAGPQVTDVSFAADITAVSDGIHTLFVRCMDANSIWSAAYSRPFFKMSASTFPPAPNLSKVEYYFDNDPGYGSGIDVPITPSTQIDDFNFSVPLGGITDGFHILYVRTMNENGAWGLSVSRPMYKIPANASAPAPDLDRVEYFIDADPGPGLGIDIPVSQGPSVTDHNFVVPLDTVAAGFHSLTIRTRDVNGNWSVTYTRPFYKPAATSYPPAPNVAKVEYFIDADPGYGAGIDIPAGTTPVVSDQAFTVPLDTVADGFHTLSVRTKDVNGDWGYVYSRPFYKSSSLALAPAPNIDKVEYFIDSDPGFGQGIDIPVTAAQNITDHPFLVELDSVISGFHTLFIRSHDENNGWGIAFSRPFVKNAFSVAPAPDLVKIEYYFDTDPGYGNGYDIPIPASTAILDSAVHVDLNNTFTGKHTLNIRAMASNGIWSIVASDSIDACVQHIPVALDATAIAPGTMTANWLDTAAAPGYKLYASKDNFKTYLKNYGPDSSIVTNSKVITNLRGGTYQYRVRSIGPKCNSGLSNIIVTLTPYIAVPEQDSLALIALFDSTNGAGWTDNSGWKTLFVEDWKGISLNNFRVVGISLPANNLGGTVPGQIVDMTELEAIDLSNNKITKLEDITGLTKLTGVNMSANKLDFGSLEPNITLPGFQYGNQANLGTVETVEIDAGTSYQLHANSAGTANTYKWYFNDQEIASGSLQDYEIADVNRTTMGEYHGEIENSIVPGLTLKTNVKTILAVADISGTLFNKVNVPATNGKVTLFKITNTHGYDTMAIHSVTANGEFIFENVILDDYQLLAFADTLLYEDALPTYFENTLYWEEADTIHLEGNKTADIISQHKPQAEPVGKGSIEGFVEEEISNIGGRAMAPKRVANAGVSVRRVERSNRSKEDVLVLVTYIFTNEQGEFKFSNLPTGEQYVFNVQYPGYPMDQSSDLNIDVGTGVDAYKSVSATVNGDKIVVKEALITGMWGKEDYKVEVFPNPSTSFINIHFEASAETRKGELMDVSGKAVTSMGLPQAQEQIDIRSFNPGIYLLNIREKGKDVKSLRIEIK
jgi:hypothetical protein